MIYWFYETDQVDIKIAELLERLSELKVRILDEFKEVTHFEEFSVDFFRALVSGFTESHRFHVKLSLDDARVAIEEAHENKIKPKETNFDNIVATTFKLGMSDSDRKNKERIKLPHFEKIDDYGKIDLELKDDEQDEEDDVDV